MLSRVVVALACLIPVSGHTNSANRENVIAINAATIVHPSQNDANLTRAYRTIKAGVVYEPEALMESIRCVNCSHHARRRGNL